MNHWEKQNELRANYIATRIADAFHQSAMESVREILDLAMEKSSAELSHKFCEAAERVQKWRISREAVEEQWRRDRESIDTQWRDDRESR